MFPSEAPLLPTWTGNKSPHVTVFFPLCRQKLERELLNYFVDMLSCFLSSCMRCGTGCSEPWSCLVRTHTVGGCSTGAA